ncbi:MAG: glycosyltransferase family 2 protein [Pelobium sp.]
MDENIEKLMSLPLISIIIPVFNTEDYLTETIESAKNQTWKNKEIIIIDDGSSDGSFALAKSYENDWIKVFSQENKGASAARNYGLREAKGEYIQFLDADDFISPNKIEFQISLLNEKKNFLCICPTIYFFDGENPYNQEIEHSWFSKGSNDTLDFLVKLYGGPFIGPDYGGMIQTNVWLTPRSVIDKAGYWNEELSLDDDGEFFCRVLLNADGIIYSKDAINYYRKYKTYKNLSAGKDYQHFKSAFNANQLKAKYILKKTDNKLAKIALSRYFWENAFSFYPRFKDLSAEAEKLAISLYPEKRHSPYQNGPKRILNYIFNWKTIKYLEKTKRKIFNN